VSTVSERWLAGVRDDLRRTFVKLARSGQAPLEQIQLALGHQNIQTTQRYLGSELDLADAACDRLGIRLDRKPVDRRA
jgi:integrase